MPPILYLDNQRFIINTCPELLQAHPSALKIKSELQRKVTPFSGGYEWDLILDQGKLLADEVGIDSEMAIYLYVAEVKVSGLAGAANGLELLYQSLLYDVTQARLDVAHFAPLLEWANQQVAKEITDLRTSYEVLRDLYRIECYCERLSHLFQTHAPQVKVDFATLAMLIFQHVDAIETSYQAACKRQGSQPVQVEVKAKSSPLSGYSKVHLTMAFAIGAAVAALLSVLLTG